MSGALSGTSASFSGPVAAGTTSVGVKMTVKDNATFSTAITALAALGGGTLELTGTVPISVTQIIPSTVNVMVDQNAGFSLASGAVLTLPVPQAGPYQIFSGSGTVAFSTGGTANAKWWGATGGGGADDTAAINAALTAVQASTPLPKLYISEGTYLVGTGMSAGNLFAVSTDNVEIYGAGIGKTIFKTPNSMSLTNDVTVIVLGGKHTYAHDFSFSGPLGGASGNHTLNGVMWQTGAYWPRTDNIECTNWNAGATAGAACLNTYQAYNQALWTTTLGTAVPSAGSATVTPGSMTGIGEGVRLQIGGSNPESVLPTSIALTNTTPTSFTATFASAHLATDSVSVISRGYQNGTARNIVCHDSALASCLEVASSGNHFQDIYVNVVGQPYQGQHGIYIQSGENIVDHMVCQNIGSVCYDDYPSSNAYDASGNRLINSEFVNPGNEFVNWSQNQINSSGAVTEQTASARLSRDLVMAHNLFKNSADYIPAQGWNIVNNVQSIGNTYENTGLSGSGAIASAGDTFTINASSADTNNYGITAGPNSSVTGAYINQTNSARTVQVKLGTNSTFTNSQVNWVQSSYLLVPVAGLNVNNSVFSYNGTGTGTFSTHTNAAGSQAQPWNVSYNKIFGTLSFGEYSGSEWGVIAHNTAPNSSIYYDGTGNSLVLDSNYFSNTGTEYSGRLVGLPCTNQTSGKVNGLAKFAGGTVTPVTASDTVFDGIVTPWYNWGGTTWSCGSTTTYLYLAGQPGSQYNYLLTDGAWTAGDFGVVSTTTAGTIHDNGSSRPGLGASYVVFLNSGSSAGNAMVLVVQTSNNLATLPGAPTNGQFWGYNGTAQGWYTPGGTSGGSSGQHVTLLGACGSHANAQNNGVGINGLGGNTLSGNCGNSASSYYGTPLPASCTLQNLYVNTQNSSVAGDGVMYVMDGSTQTPITCTIGTSTQCHDVTDTYAATAGDMIWVKGNFTAATLQNFSVSMQCN